MHRVRMRSGPTQQPLPSLVSFNRLAFWQVANRDRCLMRCLYITVT